MKTSRPSLAYAMQIFLIGACLWCASSKLIASYIMPHGGIALDPSHFNTTNETALEEAWEIHQACQTVGKEIADIQPDIIVLSSPHGIADLIKFAFYMNPTAEGYADTDNCVCPECCYFASINIDVNTTEDIINRLSSKSNVSGLSGFGPPGESSEPFPLRWGEVIPMTFIPGLNSTSSMKLVILSQPSRRYTEDVAMMPELLRLGAYLYEILEAMPERVVVIVSGDLAHTHDASGPYGFSEAADPFDEACGSWASSLYGETLLIDAARLVDDAKSCGFTGFVMLQGLLEASDVYSWSSELLVNYHPSYYGMMVARMARQSDDTPLDAELKFSTEL